MECQQCGKGTNNPKFCSRSCSAVFTNKAIPKRKRIVYRCVCGKELAKKRIHQCRSCKDRVDNSVSLAEMIYTDCHKSSAFALVRARARKGFKGKKVCAYCGYDKHVEIAHIKALADFDLQTPVSVVNADSNLISLCPNHHWEFDNGRLILN